MSNYSNKRSKGISSKIVINKGVKFENADFVT